MSYYEKRIAELEARVEQLAREQRMKAIPVEAKLLERYALMQAENSRLKSEVERLTDALNKLVKTPPEATGGVRVKVDFWTQYGSRLPSSYETFWVNAAKEGKPGV